jgi:hypothetical protein
MWSVHMVRPGHQFNLMPWEGPRLARHSPNPVAKTLTML